MTKAFEVNFDGLVGPTHNYSGLSVGNVASTRHRALESNPREAALQGLSKMKALSDWGLHQGILPPQERPDLFVLKKLGFQGSDKKILQDVSLHAPELIAGVCSASSMWTANAATISPSADSADHKVHFTPANLMSKFHRSIEHSTTALVLKKIFKDEKHFIHHEPILGGIAMGDEGAANHTRLCPEYSQRGIEFFVFGRYGLKSGGVEPKKFPARQTYEASAAIARNHRLPLDAVCFAQQNPAAIDAGVFHNDVVGVGNQDFYFFHEQAYLDSDRVLFELKDKYKKVCGSELRVLQVRESEVSLSDAVSSYLFNSQLLRLPSGKMLLLAPIESQETVSVRRFLDQLSRGGSPIDEVRFFDLRQSMRNGGGPACLRLRVVLTPKELARVHSKTLMTDVLYVRLVKWVEKNYRDRLKLEDLADPALLKESRSALDQLTQILGLGSIYSFQK